MKKMSIKIILIFITINQPILYSYRITTLKNILNQYPEIVYQKVCDEISFTMPPFQIAPSFPNKGYFKELFILTIPNGIVKGLHGYILINDGFIEELIWGGIKNLYNIVSHAQQIDYNNIIKIPGRVAVIAQLESKNYCHLICEILGRLALLEIHNIEYDYLYVPYEQQPLVQSIFKLWGIDPTIIISPCDHNFAIEAEILIVPSLVIRTDTDYKQSGNFHHPQTMAYVKNKLLNKALQEKVDPKSFNKKVFISRSDSPSGRRIANENEIFELFEKKGFTRYIPSKLSIPEQVILFHNAEIIVAEHGAALTNILFCKPNTHIIEIFQNLIPIDFCHCAYLNNLKYTPINTLLSEQDANYYSDYHKDLHKFFSFPIQPNVPLDKLYQILDTL
ncbi:glycosyltransferase family 61 protein [Candidatus Dependentiae bacterium]|nr:glycosyltransferase family 61 protein [Candidatus Dependentiae bacterium]